MKFTKHREKMEQLSYRLAKVTAAVLSFGAFAAAADPVTQYLWWSAKDAPVWKNADGDTVTWTNGNDAVWKSVPSDNATPSFNRRVQN